MRERIYNVFQSIEGQKKCEIKAYSHLKAKELGCSNYQSLYAAKILDPIPSFTEMLNIFSRMLEGSEFQEVKLYAAEFSGEC